MITLAALVLGLATQPRAAADPILHAVKAMAAAHFAAFEMDNAGSFFPASEVSHLASAGAPRNTYWESASHPCRISFQAGQHTGTQATSAQIKCRASSAAEAAKLLEPYVRAASTVLLARFRSTLGAARATAELNASESGFGATLATSVMSKPESMATLELRFLTDPRFAD